MNQPDIDAVLNVLAKLTVEPSLLAQERLKARMAEELRSINAEREAATLGLGLIYRFAHNHFKERPFVYLIPSAAVITLMLRLSLGESFIILARMISGR